ncbi:MAG: hypothetical protein U1G07_10075 [Verrucomicrobiota bacterium]
MKTVLRHTGAPLFWTPRGTWTTNPREALTFLDDVRARDYAFFHDLDQVTSAALHLAPGQPSIGKKDRHESRQDPSCEQPRCHGLISS